MRRGPWILAVAAACVVGSLFAVAALSPAKSTGPCTVAGGPAMMRGVPEASGLAVSRKRPGLLWTHNDSGNEPDLFAVDASGVVQGRVRVPIRVRDWEDVSAASCPSGECLYIGDIGNNDMDRKTVQVYRLPEPDLRAGQAAEPQVFNVTYPDGAHDAEAMFVAGGRLFFITKDRRGIIYGTTPLDEAHRALTLQRIGQLGLAAVTDAEASADEASVAVRTSKEVVIYRTADLIRGGDVQPAVRIPVDGLREPQGEGVALGNGMLYLASEGRPRDGAGWLISLRCGATPLP